jgi:Domain of unknown function (DUF4351)
MSQFPHDDFAKDFLNTLLSPFGSILPSYKISGEVRYVDLYFQPQIGSCECDPASLGFLAQFANEPLVIEPFRNSVKVPQIRACISKLFDLHLTLIKEAKKQKLSEPEDDKLPHLWILTPTLSDRLLESVGARLDLERWGEGVYVLAAGLKTGIVVIHQLPETPATLWFRLLGKGGVQERAIAEVARLPQGHPYRQNTLELLSNLKVTLEARTDIKPEDRDLIMQLSPLYLETIQAAKEQGKTEILMRQLKRRCGKIPVETVTRIQQLNVVQLEDLGEALLDFTSLADLETWLG